MQAIGIVLVLLSAATFVLGLNDRNCGDITRLFGLRVVSSYAPFCSDRVTSPSVHAVFTLCEAHCNTNYWKKNKKVNCFTTKNTAIASFSGSGETKFDINNGQASIFLSCTRTGDIRVADQWCGRIFNERILLKNCSSNTKPYYNCADKFYTFDW